MPDGIERRRDNEYVTYAELRRALQGLFDQKARTEVALRFFEGMRLLGLEELLPLMLKDERTRQILSGLSTASLARWRRRAIVAGVLSAFVLLASFVLNIIQLFRTGLF